MWLKSTDKGCGRMIKVVVGNFNFLIKVVVGHLCKSI